MSRAGGRLRALLCEKYKSVKKRNGFSLRDEITYLHSTSMIRYKRPIISVMPSWVMNESTQETASFRNSCLSLCSFPTSTDSGFCTLRRYLIKSSGTGSWADLPDADRSPSLENADLSIGPEPLMSTDFGRPFEVVRPDFCFLAGDDSPLRNDVNVRLRGRAFFSVATSSIGSAFSAIGDEPSPVLGLPAVPGREDDVCFDTTFKARLSVLEAEP